MAKIHIRGDVWYFKVKLSTEYMYKNVLNATLTKKFYILA